MTGKGGIGVCLEDQVGPASPLGLRVGDAVATLVSLTLTPLQITDGLAGWDGRSAQVPADGHAVLFARSSAAVLPNDVPAELAMAVLDVCGAPALTARVVTAYARGCGSPAARGPQRPVVAVLGAAGKSGSLSLAAARRAGAAHTIGVVPSAAEAVLLTDAALADAVVVADARDPVALAAAVNTAGGPAQVSVVCVDVPGCEHVAILPTAEGGTESFFSMAPSFAAAALGAEGLAADITMIIGNGYVPGHAVGALALLRDVPGVRALFEGRLAAAH